MNSTTAGSYYTAIEHAINVYRMGDSGW